MFSLVEDQNRAVEAVIEERNRQDEKWGVQNHSQFTWQVIQDEENGEIAQAILNLESYFHTPNPDVGVLDTLRKRLAEELIQNAAVALARLECAYRQGYIDRRG